MRQWNNLVYKNSWRWTCKCPKHVEAIYENKIIVKLFASSWYISLLIYMMHGHTYIKFCNIDFDTDVDKDVCFIVLWFGTRSSSFSFFLQVLSHTSTNRSSLYSSRNVLLLLSQSLLALTKMSKREHTLKKQYFNVIKTKWVLRVWVASKPSIATLALCNKNHSYLPYCQSHGVTFIRGLEL